MQFTITMNKLALIGIGLALATVGSANQALKAHIQSKYDQFAEMSRIDIKKSIPTAAKFLTSDFLWIDTQKTEYDVTKYVEIQSAMTGKVSKIYDAQNVILSYREDGIYVRIRVKSILDFKKLGFSADRYQGVTVTDDIWVKTINGWKMCKSTNVNESLKINGEVAGRHKAAVMTARMTSAGVVHPAAALAFPSSSMVR